MKKLLAALMFTLAPVCTHAASDAADPGLVSRASPYPVAETLDRLETLLKAKGIKIFARIDHSAEAQSAGLTLRSMQLLIFGNPKAGTPLMQTAPGIGLDLPMKALAWQDAQDQVHVTWNSPEFLIGRHGLGAESAKNLV